MSFDRFAPHYRWMEAVLAGDLLQRCRVRWLSEVRESRNVLLVGEGNGRMLEACASALPECRFTVVDQSEAMLDQARWRWQKSKGKQHATFQRANVCDWRARDSQFDLVITNFFLDCFISEELHRVMTNITAALTPQARWLLADFSVPQQGWRRVRARAVLAMAYGFFRVTTGISARQIACPDETLRAAGFVLRQRQWFNHGLLHADLWERRDSNFSHASVAEGNIGCSMLGVEC